MSQDLFEKYLQDRLSEPEMGRLNELLSSPEGSRAFVDFLREWSLLADVSRALSTHPVDAIRPETARIRLRRVSPPGRTASIAWFAGLAAAVLFLIGLVLSTGHGPSRGTPSATAVRKDDGPQTAPLPAPAPPERLAPAAEPDRPQPRPSPAPSAPAPAPEPVPERAPAPRPEPAPEQPSPLPAPPPPLEKPTLTAVAVVERVQGTVNLTSREGSRGVAAGQEIAAEQGLQTSGRGAVATVKFPDLTRIELGADTAVERFADLKGKSVLMSRGSLSASVTRQPAGKPLTIRTPHAEATVLGTQLTLAVTPDATRLEVREGKVKLTRLADGASIDVSAGHVSIAAKGVKLDSRVLVLTADFQDGVFPTPAYSGTRDTSLSGADPARNFGAADPIEADGDEIEGKKIYALIKWDLSDIPPASTVRSAVLTFNITDVSLGSGYHLYEVRRPWVEGEANWKVFAAARDWKTPGARAPQDRGTEIVGTVAPRTKGSVAILLNPAGEALVQSWIRNPAANHGLLIANDTNADGFKFSTRESPQPDRRPRLTVEYVGPAR